MSLQSSNALLTNFIAQSAAMMDVMRGVDSYARALTPLILVGATGSGKTTLAELIHAQSLREGPFAAHTAGEFERNLEHSQLFGHERGAFTGAADRHVGALEESAGGTLLLDDFHHLRRSTQTLLLRVLDRGVFRRLGGSRDLPLLCRVIVGLTDTPDQLVERGTLLIELRYRLGYCVIRLPTLAERREDIPALAARFLTLCPSQTEVEGPEHLAPEVISLLQTALWPGNVRQLEMVVRDAYLRARGSRVVRISHVADLVQLPVRFMRWGDPATNARAVRLALQVARGQVDGAARLLSTSRSTIYHYRDSSAAG